MLKADYFLDTEGEGEHNGRNLMRSECNTMKQEIAQTSFLAIDRAIDDILSKLSKKSADYDAVVFLLPAVTIFPYCRRR